MKNVWETCKFSDEIINGDLGIAKFAVELHSILDGTADKNYLNPEIFLDNTYVTDAIEVVLINSLLRLSKNQGNASDLLDVGFGGGKTHSLVLLYHIFKNKELGTKFINKMDIPKKYGIKEIPDVNVVAIDCRQMKKKTLWGEIANRLGKYEEFKKLDEDRKPPEDISMIKSFFDKPTLLLLDEIPHYLVKTKSISMEFFNTTLLFLNELVSAINNVKYSKLILTSTADQKLLEDTADKVKKIATLDATGITDSLKGAVSRGTDPLVPVKEKDSYGVICKRLVKEIDEKERDKIVDAYFDYYIEKGLITEQNYKQKMKKAYPFHPFFIETLYKRVGTIQDFNKTRGMFRLLGLVLHYIYKNKIPCTLVGPGDLQLHEQPIMDDLTSKVNRPFQEVIQSDCIDKSQELDKGKNEKIVQRIARTIYLYSLIGAAKINGIHLPELQLAVGRPGLDTGLIEKALYEEVENEFWFIKNLHGEFYFDQEPNINRIIAQYKKEVSSKELRDTIYETIKSLTPERTGVKPVIWSENELAENDTLRIFVRDYEDAIDDDTAINEMHRILTQKPGGEIREKQNTIVMLYPDKNGIDALKDKARGVSGIKRAEKDERIKLNKESEIKLKSRLSTAKGDLETVCIQVYSKVIYPKGAEPRLDQISTIETHQNNLTAMIIELLINKGKLLPPEKELSHEIIQVEKVTSITKILENFKIDKSKHFILENQQIFDAAGDGIKAGAFGYSEEAPEQQDGKYVGKIEEIVFPSWSGFLIPKELVVGAKLKPEPKVEPLIPGNFRYKIHASDVEKILEVLSQLSILSIDAQLQKNLQATLEFKDTSISITSKLDNTDEMKSLLNTLKSRGYSGEGLLTISSDTDVSKDLKKWGDDFEQE